MKWWNGDKVQEDAIYHHCALTSTSPTQMQFICGHLARSAVLLLMRCTPSTPEEGKWTKAPSAVDFVALALLPNSLLTIIVQSAASQSSIKVEHFKGKWSILSFADSQSVRGQYGC